MNKTIIFQPGIDLAQEFASGNYEKVINYVEQIQRELTSIWQSGDSKTLEQMILMSRNIFNFWTDSVSQDRFHAALIRCGALIGTLETIGKSMYENNMDFWIQKRVDDIDLLNNHLAEIIELIDAKKVISHDELIKELHVDCTSALTEFIKNAVDLQLIHINRLGKYQTYSLTDVGMRYAKKLKAEK